MAQRRRGPMNSLIKDTGKVYVILGQRLETILSLDCVLFVEIQQRQNLYMRKDGGFWNRGTSRSPLLV